MAIGTQAAFWACSFSHSHVEVTADVRPLPPSSLELEGLCYSEKYVFSLLIGRKGEKKRVTKEVVLVLASWFTLIIEH